MCRENFRESFKSPTKIKENKVHGFKEMIVAKYETERLISVDSKTTSFFTRKWFISVENFV